MWILLGTIKSKYDATPTERELLGRAFASFERQVVDSVSWIVGLPDA